MEFYLGVMSIIFVGLCKSNQYKNICGTDRGLFICCSGYYLVDGECIVCPIGSFGVNCSKPCPKGFFGEACENQCDCSENEVSDTAYGCSGNTTDCISAPLSSAELTTVLHDTKTSTELPAVPLFLYLVSVGCISLFFITCLMIIHRIKRRTSIRNDGQENVRPKRVMTCETQENLRQPSQPNVDEALPSHEYIEIIDIDSTYLEPCSVSAV